MTARREAPLTQPTWSHFLVSVDLREVKLSVVSFLTNSIVDQILQELYTTHKTLVLVISLCCMLSPSLFIIKS